jgi:hypothetical protein
LTGRPVRVRVASVLRAPADEVWAGAVTLDGVNRELGPWVRMAAPRPLRRVSIDLVPRGRVAIRCWLLALGVLPFDRHALRLDDVGERWFRERSTSWLQAAWDHDRRIEDHPEGCLVEDVVGCAPRLSIVAPLVGAIVTFLFRHRHRRLRARYGGRPAEAST